MTQPASPPAHERPIGVSYPFRLVLEHAPLDVHDMFIVTQAFDLYEVIGVEGENRGKARKDLFVDVLEVETMHTTVVVTPMHSMTYEEMGRQVEHMLNGLAKHYLKGKVKVSKIIWNVDKTGIAADLKGRIHVVA